MSSFLHTGNGIVKVGQVMMVSINTLVVMYDRVFTSMHGCLCVHVTMCVCVYLLSVCAYIRTYVRTHAACMYVCMCVRVHW